MKKLICAALILTMAFSFVACGEDKQTSGNGTDVKNQTGSQEQKDSDKSDKEADTATEAGLKDGFQSSEENIKIKINDAWYQLPSQTQAFFDNGFEDSFPDNHTLKIKAGSSGGSATLVKDGVAVNLSFANFTESEVSYKETTATSIRVSSKQSVGDKEYDKMPEAVELIGGVKLGKSTKEEVIALYGKPSSLSTSKVSEIINADYDDFNIPEDKDGYFRVRLTFDIDTEILRAVEMSGEYY